MHQEVSAATEEIGTYTSETEAQEIEARNAQVKAEAEALYTEWVNGGASEEAFIQMAKDHSEDGNASTGGLYTGVTPGYMVQEFNDWIFDESRQVGDYGLVKTQYGYHIMYFVGGEDIWYAEAKAALIGEMAQNMVTEILTENSVEVTYKDIAFAELSFS